MLFVIGNIKLFDRHTLRRRVSEYECIFSEYQENMHENFGMYWGEQ